ncbi:phage tail protein [Eubacterium aggregans]|uniref:phage tail protein n=1 Tax=Eubacterium aggregans TaxID=81409 RepID=UPI003F3AE5D2
MGEPIGEGEVDESLQGRRWCQTVVGGVLSERVPVVDGQVQRRIDILSSVGDDKGKVLYDDREISDITITVPERTNYTMAYGYGASTGINDDGSAILTTFKDVVWSTTNGDPVDKPAGQDWVSLPQSYLDAFGIIGRDGTRVHRCTYWMDSDVSIPENILKRTYDALLDNLADNTEYKITADDYQRLGYSLTEICEGDTIGVVVTKLANLKLKAEVVRYTDDYIDPGQNDFELANFLANPLNTLLSDNSALENIKNRLN